MKRVLTGRVNLNFLAPPEIEPKYTLRIAKTLRFKKAFEPAHVNKKALLSIL